MIRVMIIVRPIDTDCIVIMQMPAVCRTNLGKVVTGVFGICLLVVTGVVDDPHRPRLSSCSENLLSPVFFFFFLSTVFFFFLSGDF